MPSLLPYCSASDSQRSGKRGHFEGAELSWHAQDCAGEWRRTWAPGRAGRACFRQSPVLQTWPPLNKTLTMLLSARFTCSRRVAAAARLVHAKRADNSITSDLLKGGHVCNTGDHPKQARLPARPPSPAPAPQREHARGLPCCSGRTAPGGRAGSAARPRRHADAAAGHPAPALTLF
jgi:hypothetical protein